MMTSVLIVGAGGIGERHVRCFQKAGIGRVGIVESQAERRELIAARYGCPGFADCEEALKAEPWTVGVVASPAPSHIPIATRLAEAGLNLLIEKPLAVVPDGLDRLQVFEAIRTMRVAYVYRHMLPVMELKRRLQAGSLGNPLAAQIVCGEDYSLARPDYARIYYGRHETGGGAIQDVLTHFVNTMDWLVGPARDVQCLVGNRKLRDVSVEDTVCCSIRHEGGCLAGYYVCQGQAPAETSFTVHCENGSVRAALSQQRVGEFRPGDAEWTWTQFGPVERDEIYVRQAKAFLDAMAGHPDHACMLAEAVHSLNVNIAALESARSGRCITVVG